jgi:hypothetical protein
VKNLHRVEDSATFYGEGLRGTIELEVQNAQVEALEVEAAEVAAIEKGVEVGGEFLEPGLIGDIGVCNAVNGCYLRWDRDARVDAVVSSFPPPVGQDFENADLDDARCLGSVPVVSRSRIASGLCRTRCLNMSVAQSSETELQLSP